MSRTCIIIRSDLTYTVRKDLQNIKYHKSGWNEVKQNEKEHQKDGSKDRRNT